MSLILRLSLSLARSLSVSLSLSPSLSLSLFLSLFLSLSLSLSALARTQGLDMDVNWASMTEEEKRRALLNDELVQVLYLSVYIYIYELYT